MTNEQCAYLAGLIDGEGSILLEVDSERRSHATLRVEISNTDVRMTDWLYSVCGGVVSIRLRSGNERDHWRWRIHGKKAADLLGEALPYLVTKKTQAKIVLVHRQLVGSVGKRINLETRVVRNLLAIRLKRLNRKGRIP